jgi:hypothetical protein
MQDNIEDLLLIQPYICSWTEGITLSIEKSILDAVAEDIT